MTLHIKPLIDSKDGVKCELLGYSKYLGVLKVRSLDHGYEKVLRLHEVLLEDR